MKNSNTAGGARLRDFFDAGSFVELGAYIERHNAENGAEGVVCGYGALEGRLVFAFAQDSTLMKGALDGRHADKIAMVYEKAMAVGAPVVGMFDSAGALVFDGAAALGGYAKLLRTVSAASGVIPQIALISGVCAGTMAAVAALFDFTVTVSGASKLYVNSPALVGEAVATAEYAYEKRNAALLTASEAEAFASIKRILFYLPDAAENGAPRVGSIDDINRAVSLAGRTTAAEALNAVADAGSLMPLYGGAAPEVVSALATLGGVAVAAVALDGALTLAGIEKMRRAAVLADTFGLPLVTLLNCSGLAAEPCEEAALADAMARLADTLACSSNARISAVVGEAIGLGFILGSRSLGADLVLALPEAEIAALAAPAAVAFLWNDRITPALSRDALEKEWRETRATALAAAATGEVDDVIEPAELRARLIAGVYMLAGKKR